MKWIEAITGNRKAFMRKAHTVYSRPEKARHGKYKTIQMRILTSQFITKQFTKNRNDKYEQTTTTELQAHDLGQANKEVTG